MLIDSIFPPSNLHLFEQLCKFIWLIVAEQVVVSYFSLFFSLYLPVCGPSLGRTLLLFLILSTCNYVRSMRHLMKYSFRDTKSVCACARRADDGEAVDVFNKHKTAKPRTLTALASNSSLSLAHVHAGAHAHTGICRSKAQTCRKFMYK